MRSALAIALCLVTGAASSQARDPATYFGKPKAAAPQPNLKLPPLPTKPGTALPPLELPPLPPAPTAPPAAKAEAPVSKREAPVIKLEDDSAKADEKAKPAKPKDSPFLSRAALEEKRRNCKVEAPALRSLTAKPKGDMLTVKLRQSAGENCLSAASADTDWVEASINSRTAEVTLRIEPNDAEKRMATINVLAGNDTIVLTVEQPAQVRGCRRATFVRRSAAPIPDGFEE